MWLLTTACAAVATSTALLASTVPLVQLQHPRLLCQLAAAATSTLAPMQEHLWVLAPVQEHLWALVAAQAQAWVLAA